MKPHDELRVRAGQPWSTSPRDAGRSGRRPPWEAVPERSSTARGRSARARRRAQFVYPRPYVAYDRRWPSLCAQRPSRRRGRCSRRRVDLMHRIHAEFTFDAAATTVIRRRSRGCSRSAAACARTSRTCRSRVCGRSGCRRATSAATCSPTRRPVRPRLDRRRRLACLAVGVLPGARLGRPRSDERRDPRRSARHGRRGAGTTAT